MLSCLSKEEGFEGASGARPSLVDWSHVARIRKPSVELVLNWLNAHGVVALWLGCLALLSLAACAGAALLSAARQRRSRTLARLWAARRPILALCDIARDLRDKAEQGAGLKPADLASLAEGAFGQRIRDVRSLQVEALPSPRAIEAAYEAREAAARLLVWLERPVGDAADTRHRIQAIWKALHDAAGNLQRDIAALEASNGGRLPS